MEGGGDARIEYVIWYGSVRARALLGITDLLAGDGAVTHTAACAAHSIGQREAHCEPQSAFEGQFRKRAALTSAVKKLLSCHPTNSGSEKDNAREHDV